MNPINPLALAVYRRALWLYPAHLRSLYRDEILQSISDAHSERSSSFGLWLFLFADLFKSSFKEHLLMIRDRLQRNPVLVHAIALGVILTLMGGFASLVFQQMLRRGADQPQIQMAQVYTDKLASGSKAQDVIPAAHVDLRQSLEPFAIFYDDQGVPVSSTGYLSQAIPAPPQGVFTYVRTHGKDRITWQPGPDVRIAAIVQRVPGPNQGFLLAGRSLRVVEEQEGSFWRMVLTAWFILVALLIAGVAFLGRSQRVSQGASGVQA
jgi:hypothetical protein